MSKVVCMRGASIILMILLCIIPIHGFHNPNKKIINSDTAILRIGEKYRSEGSINAIRKNRTNQPKIYSMGRQEPSGSFNLSHYLFWEGKDYTDYWTSHGNMTWRINYPSIINTLVKMTSSINMSISSSVISLQKFESLCVLAYMNRSYLADAEKAFSQIVLSETLFNTTTGFPVYDIETRKTNLGYWWVGLFMLYRLTRNCTYLYWLKKSISTYIDICRDVMLLNGDKIKADGSIIDNPGAFPGGYNNMNWGVMHIYALFEISSYYPQILNESQKYDLALSIRKLLDLIYENFGWGYLYYEFYTPLTRQVRCLFTGQPRCHMAMHLYIFKWASELLNNATFSEMVHNMTISLDKYWAEGNIVHFKYHTGSTLLEQYTTTLAYTYFTLGLNKTRSILQVLLSHFVGVEGSELSWKNYFLPHIHASSASYNPSTESWAWSTGTSEFKLHISVLLWRASRYIYPYPYPYIVSFFMSRILDCFRDDGVYTYFSSSSWRKGLYLSAAFENFLVSSYRVRLYGNLNILSIQYMIPSVMFSNIDYNGTVVLSNIVIPKGLSALYMKGLENVSIEIHGNTSQIRWVYMDDGVLLLYNRNQEQNVSIVVLVGSGTSYGYGDDADGDGLYDAFERLYGVNSSLSDDDNDGLPNIWEELFYTDPYSNDTDSDGLSDFLEFYYTLNPLSPDTDYDGLNDSLEINYGLNPLDRHTISYRYTDYMYPIYLKNYSCGFNWDEYYNGLDSDEDGIPNYMEMEDGTNPYDPNDSTIYLQIMAPKNNSYINETHLYVEWNYWGYVSNFSIYENGTLIDTVPRTTTSYNITDLTEGLWNITILAKNNAGYSAKASLYIVVDTSPPVVNILMPENNSVLNSSFTLMWNATDNWGIQKIVVILDGCKYAEYIYGYNMTNIHEFRKVTNGSHVIEVVVYDFAYNMNRSLITIEVIGITIHIVYPEHLEYTNKSWVQIKWVMSGSPKNISIYINGTILAYFEESITEYNVSIPMEGIWNVTIIVYDIYGNLDYDSVVIISDFSPPLLNVISPVNMTVTNEVCVDISWESSDNFSGVDYIEIHVDDNTIYILDQYCGSICIFLGHGVHIIRVCACDRAGNTAIITIFIAVDIIPPEISPPLSDAICISSNNLNLRWIGIDDFTGVQCYYIKIDDSSWTYIGNESYYYLENLSEGTHIIYIKAVDNVGNVRITTRRLIVDMTPPTIIILSPSNGSYINDEVLEIRWYAADKISGIQLFTLYLDNVAWILFNNCIKIENLGDGQHYLRIIAIDRAGNSLEKNISFIVDRSPPKLNAYVPIITFGNKISIEINTTDNIAIWKIYVRVDGGRWIEANISRTIILYASSGKHIIQIKVVDRASNFAVETIKTIVIGSTITVAFVVVIVIIVIQFKRRISPRNTKGDR